MEYFKCHWCGSTHNRNKNSCPNCGGTLELKSAIRKSHHKIQGRSVNELTQLVHKISGMLVLICVILVSVSAYFLFTNISHKSEKSSVETVFQKNKQLVYKPINISGYKQSPGTLKQSLGYLANKKYNCVLDFDKNITPDVYLVTSYKGLQASKVKSSSRGHEIRESEVIVNKPGEKIILVLMAYDPVVWKINKSYNTSVTGVILAGYHDQFLIGLPKKTPVLEAIYEKKTICSYFYNSLKHGRHIHYIDNRIKDIVGSQPTEYITNPINGKFYVSSNNKVH